jgi:hypothetical protein
MNLTLVGMTLKSRARSHSIVLGFLGLLLASCVTNEPFVYEPTETSSTEICEYKNVYVSSESLYFKGDGIRDLEEKRLLFLRLAADAARRIGLRIVADRADAYYLLRTGATYTIRPGAELTVVLQGTLKLSHHIFLSLNNDEDFPFRGRVGSSHGFFLNDIDSRSEEDYPRLAEKGLRSVWNQESPQIEALCNVREELVAEGWADIEELRQKLIEDMMRVRAERARATQEKALTLEIEK